MPTNLVLGSLLPDLQMTAFSLYPHMAERERERELWSLLIKTVVIMGSNLVTSSKTKCLPNAPPPNPIILDVRASTYELEGDTNIQSITSTFLPHHPLKLILAQWLKAIRLANTILIEKKKTSVII